jgi:hypothetical protein
LRARAAPGGLVRPAPQALQGNRCTPVLKLGLDQDQFDKAEAVNVD